MDTPEKIGYSLFAAWVLTVVVIFGCIWYETTLPERMARDGYQPYRLTGSNEVYWVKPQEAPAIKGF